MATLALVFMRRVPGIAAEWHPMATDEERERRHTEELEAIAAGVRSQLEALDERVELWRSSMMSAFSLLAQRDSSDERDRKARQAKLDRELLLLKIGVALALLQLLALVFLFIGSHL